MKRPILLVAFVLTLLVASMKVRAQETSAKPQPDQAQDANGTQNSGHEYSGMYSFLKEGEFVQVTVEEAGHVTGFISRFGNGESDKGAFLDQFFKTGKLEGNRLSFTTDIVHGVSFDFKGTVERGDGKTPGEEGYYVLKGTLTQSTADVNKKVTSHSQEVAFKKFPQEAAPAAVPRK